MKTLKAVVDGTIVDFDTDDSVIRLANRAPEEENRVVFGSVCEFQHVFGAVDKIVGNAAVLGFHNEENGKS